MSWYPPPPDPYGGYGGYPPPAPPPPPGQPYYGYQPPAPAAPPPPPQYAASAYGRYDYGAYAGYAQQPPPPAPAPAPPAPVPYGAYAAYSPPPPPVQAVAPSPQPPPLKEGELRPPPDVGVDPNSFRRYFAQQLQGLTFNSKPIITALTLFAHEHLVRMSSVVAQCLEEHIRTYLLPVFYLLDSISKNIGAPYLALFARFLERSFLSAYHAVDAPTKTKLEELLGTWKTGGSDGGELFRGADEPRDGGRVQRGIESALFGARGRGDGIGGRAAKDAEMYNAGVQQLPHTATSTERSGVLYDVRRLLTLRQEQAAANPADANNQSQIVALKKLESLILNTQLTTEQVNQIRAQLAALAPPPPPAPVVQQSPPPPPPAAAATLSPPQPQQQSLAAALASLTPTLQPPAAAAAPAQGLVGGIDLGLLSQLSASGALNNLFAPATPSEAGVKLEEARAQVKKDEGGPVRLERDEMAQAWEDEVLRLAVGLTNAELVMPRPHGPALLYTALALPCTQCGLRFFDSAQGKLKMDQHLDWHFTHKRRIREAQGRTAGRGWFTKEEASLATLCRSSDWYTSDSLTTGELSHSSDPSAASGFSTTGGGGAASGSAAGAGAIDRAALRKLKVPVPAGGGLGDKPCPICQDKLKSEWSDDEEEWVWWNAVVVDGTLYHATCHAEATLSRTSAAAAATAAASTKATSVRTSRESTPATAATKKRAAPAASPVPTMSPVKPDPDAAGGETGEGEPELKRVKVEPGTEEA
ncbi:hypothetical protein Rhopal_003069-T1 [Rhodotorula paludigena]|uniref:CID domain-containing protein n=1 Tax=Rhodotorula paludigena TaxID=86838 RepID=A0AAV5GKN8_9BASI|nr:hypothetical protein Rhopal_003069-T1 [Rhodotorula paludigena]